MKKELPFAVALLAAGCLLWLSQPSEPANSTVQISSDSDQTADTSQSLKFGIQDGIEIGEPLLASTADESSDSGEPYAVAKSSYQEDIQPSPEPLKNDSSTSVGPGPGSPLDVYIHPVSNPQAISFLSDLSKQISNSQPFGSSVELTGNLFGQVVSATGDYYQMGQGSHKSRLELVFGTRANSPSVIQLCDGRFVYKFQSAGETRSLEFVDLQRVRKKAGELGSGITPSGWVASGGIASLFQHLASAFNFGEPELSDQSSVTMRGSWDDNALRQVAGVADDVVNSTEHPASRLSQIPAQLPHAVELVFRRDETLNYFPKRIKFLRFEESKKGFKPTPMVILEFSEPRLLPNFSERYFVVDSKDFDSVDMTDKYITRIEKFDRLERTAFSDETIDR